MSVRDAQWQVGQSIGDISYALPRVEKDWGHRDLTAITAAFDAFKAEWEKVFGAPDSWH